MKLKTARNAICVQPFV